MAAMRTWLLGLAVVVVVVVVDAAAAAQVPQVHLITNDDSSPLVSRIGLGTLHIADKISGLTKPEEVLEWQLAGLSLGINTFDFATVYPVKGGDAGDSARLFGEALAMQPGLREQLFLNCKIGLVFPGMDGYDGRTTFVNTSVDYFEEKVDWFIDALQLGPDGYLDMVMLHFPSRILDVEAFGAAIDRLIDSGKIHHFGVSNFEAHMFDTLQSRMRAPIVTNEIEISVYNPLHFSFSNSVVDHLYQSYRRPISWSSLGGDPAGGVNRLFVRPGNRQFSIKRALKDVGNRLGADEQTTALAWVLRHPSGVVPLIGTTNLDRMATQVLAIDVAEHMNDEQWWSIASMAGLCPLTYSSTDCTSPYVFGPDGPLDYSAEA